MASQPRIFEKNFIDLNNESASIAVTDTQSTNNGSEVVDFLRNRNNTTSWVTSGSADSYNTQLEYTLGGVYRVHDILLIGHNFKNYTLEYIDGLVWTELLTVADNTDTTTYHHFDEILTSQIRLTITGTMVADDNKFMKQTIITRGFKSGQFQGFPTFKVSLDQNKKVNEMLSGKVNISQSLGGYNIEVAIKSAEYENDLVIYEEMYERFSSGFLLWPNAGDNAQFRSNRKFWTNEDIFLVRPIDSWMPNWYLSIYTNGMELKAKLKEVTR